MFYLQQLGMYKKTVKQLGKRFDGLYSGTSSILRYFIFSKNL